MTQSYAERLLRELLAIIHGDGGHTTDRLGLDKATTVAIRIVAPLLAESDEVERLRERMQCRRDLPWCDCSALERERDEARAEVEQLKQELSCGHAFHKCSVAEKEAEIRRTQAVEAERDEALASHRVCAAAAAELLNDLYEEVLRLTTERNEARAEVERLRAEEGSRDP